VFPYDFADIQAQLDILPLRFRLWFAWLGLVILVSPLAFVRRRQGRVALALAAVFVAAQLPLLHSVGITYLLALPHLLVWVPLLFYLCRELRAGEVPLRSPIGVWMSVAILTLVVSLVFDLRDLGRWLLGERGLIQPASGVHLPWLTLPAMVIALGGAGLCILGARSGHRTVGG
jgi:hypothetical protein